MMHHLMAIDLCAVAALVMASTQSDYYMISQKNWALLPMTLMTNYLH
jgi:hypothetical protein